jgi:hypothetical protein
MDGNSAGGMSVQGPVVSMPVQNQIGTMPVNHFCQA